MTKNARNSLYEEGSETNHLVLQLLGEALRDVGFSVRKKSRQEATLRVYPEKSGQYPLLNPRFKHEAKDVNPRWNKECLLITVLSKGADVHLDPLLSSFRSASCSFSPQGLEILGGYRYHGDFFVPLRFHGEPDHEQIDFALLSQSLVEIRNLFRRR